MRKYVFSRGFGRLGCENTAFSRVLGPRGTILRSNCGPDGSLDVSMGLGGPGTSKTYVFSSSFAMDTRTCSKFSCFLGLTREFLLLMGPPFSSISGSIWHPRADIKIYSCFTRIFNSMFMNLWLILKHLLRKFQPGTVLVRY